MNRSTSDKTQFKESDLQETNKMGTTQKAFIYGFILAKAIVVAYAFYLTYDAL